MPLKSFFKYLDTNFRIAAPLYNWRCMVNSAWDFEVFRNNFLTPTEELAETVVCAFPCSEKCRSRKIVHVSDGKIKAVCSKRDDEFFYIAVEEIVNYKLEINYLNKAIETALKNNEVERPNPTLLPEIIVPAKEEIPDFNHPVQHVFPFAKRHIYKEIDGENVYWYVDGKPVGQIYKRQNSRKAKILNLLYNEIGNGWIPHQTFINMTGWTEEEYYGKDRTDPGRMQRVLFLLRKKIKIKIEFNKNLGIKFPDDLKNGKSSF